MKIAVDISQIIHQATGVARYTKELIEALLNYDRKNDYVFVFYSLRQKLNRSIEFKIKKHHSLKKFFLPPTILEFLWNKLHIFSIDNLIGKNDLLLTSDWVEPPSQTKKITVVHDLVFIKFPETLDKKIVTVQKRRLEWVKKESSLIVTDSYSTKNDILKLLNIPQKKIKVIYPAVQVSKPQSSQIRKTLAKYQIKKPFILTVGKIEPRKNLHRLIKAFIKTKPAKLKLIIVGPKGWGGVNKQLTNLTYKNNIKLLGVVSDIELYCLYKAADFFIYPSLYEGFGYPVVEAMKLGCPIATSNTSALKEIAQGAGLLFNPLDENMIAKTINTLYHSPDLQNKLRLKGIKKAKQFSLKKYGRQLVKTFQQVYNN